ncbi:MAG TPA: thioesterase family protein [Paracoccaceae bacterium]|nr:thioesterase family protein [Paracoccaceae bacterium]
MQGEDGAPRTYAAEPVSLPLRQVAPDWIDYNGHMNVAYYTMAFDQAIDLFLEEALGIGPAFVARSGMGPYALQAHFHYLGELRAGESFVPRIRLVDCDAKRMHVFCELLHGTTGALCATLEQVIVNVDHATRRATPYPDWAQARLQAMKAAHAGPERPRQLGAPIGLARRDREAGS